jgi:cytochrome c biogenesis protein CcmG/thiol:disulfide interchange protein DsbE
MKRRLVLLIPLLLFLGTAVFLFKGLYLNPTELPSALIDKPFPVFSLTSVDEPSRTLTEIDFKGKPALVNVWGTWCVACREEHPVLNALKQQGVTVYGINYKDDHASAQKWLQEFHNPYQLDVSDNEGSLGLDLGVYGAPETFLIDSAGVIRYKHVGIVSEDIWRNELAPRYQQLLEAP